MSSGGDVRIVWIETFDQFGFVKWQRYTSYSSWGLFLTDEFQRHVFIKNQEMRERLVRCPETTARSSTTSARM